MVNAPLPVRLQFGPFLADFRARELRKDGRRIRLQQKPMLLLGALASKPGEVISREDLQKLLWPADTFVDFEIGLNAAVRKLREALADSAENPKYIETIPKHGYRFVAPVAPDRTEQPALAPRQTRTDPAPTDTSLGRRTIASLVETVSEYRRAKRFWMSIALALALSAVGLTLVQRNVVKMPDLRERVFGANGSPTIHSIAVLPLQSLSPDPSQEYFSDGMTDALITGLAHINSVKVISRTSTMQYKQTKKPLPDIARELNVDGIVEGTVQRSGDRVRVTAQFIHGPSDKHLWANSYERDMRDAFTLERDIAGDIANQIQARLTNQNPLASTAPAPSRSEQPGAVNVKALEAYLQGNYHLDKGVRAPRDTELRTAGAYFQQAIDLDPNFALAYVGLAEAHHNVWWPSSEDFTIMLGAAEKAVALDATSSDARVELAKAKFEGWDWPGAEEEYRRAIMLNGSNAMAHDWLGSCLDTMGRLEEGWKEFELAQELDPLQAHLTEPLRRRGEYGRSIELLLKIREVRPNDAIIRWQLFQNYLGKGMDKEWVEELGRSMTLFGFPEVAGRLQRAFVTSGHTGAIRQWAREFERLAANKQAYFPGILAQAYTFLGDKDRAFQWLDEGVEHKHMAVSDPVLQFLKVDSGFTSLRSDPRYKALIRRMALPP